MKILLTTLALSCVLSATLPAAELLLNGNFESPLQTTNGNHLGVAPGNWVVANPNTPTTADNSLSNLFRGTVTSGTGATAAQSLAPCPQDTTSGAQQSLDGNGATVVVSQSFTPDVTLNSRIEIKISFGGRDSGSDGATTAGSSWQLINTATNAVLASAAGFKPATGAWVQSDVVTANAVTLAAGTTYRFQVTLDNPAHMDAASITTVPEPTVTAALAGGLLLLGLGVRRAKRV